MEHNHEHTHTHTHDGVEHTHTHTHPHLHPHGDEGHGHKHEALDGHGDSDKVLAVLTYMLEHNVHHCAELKDLANSLSGESQHQLFHAIEAFDQANDHLAKAVGELKK